jgi:hypothetical protein
MGRRMIAALLLALGIVALPNQTATAKTGSFIDETTTVGPMDIHRVTVVSRKRLQIRIFVDDLQRRFGRSASVWIDKNPDRFGAEFFIGSGLYESDWQISRARGWRVVGSGPLNCPVDQRLDFRRDVISWTTGRACLGKYSAIRVSAEARRGATTDYSPRRHRFHTWVGRG